jgi:hypothetical protein
MTNVDDVDIAGADSMDEAAKVISDLLSIPVSTLPDGRPYLRVDEDTVVTMYPDDDYPGQWIAEVRSTGDDPDVQHRLARSIFDGLAARTTWGLTLISDDNPNYVVATRSRC